MSGDKSTVLKKGWLKKQGGLVKNWQDRWFVLRDQSLYYYTKEDESKQQGVIELLGGQLTELPYNRDEPDRWLFDISQVPRPGRADSYVIWASEEAERSAWMGAIRRAMYKDIGGGVFGGPLLEVIRYDRTHYNCPVPHVVKQCVEIILSNGKEVEGIFRLSGRLAQVKEMRRRYDMGERPDFNDICVDVHTAASLLKLYFRELPEPVIPFQHFESFLNLATSFRYNSNHEQTFKNLKALVKKIPTENYHLLDYLTGFLFEISKYQEINKMTEKNIAVIFGTNILRSDEDNSPEFQMATQNLTTHVVLALVKWHDLVFSESTSELDEPHVDEKEFEQLVSLSEEPAESTTPNGDPETSSLEPVAVDDLLGIDFTKSNDEVFPEVTTIKSPPPIPPRAQEQENNLDSSSNDSSVNNLSRCVSADSPSVAERPKPKPRNIEASHVQRRTGGGSIKVRPTAILDIERSPSPPSQPMQRKSGTMPVTKVEREKSNFTSFIDSPLDGRISLNIGDLPTSVEDLQSLVLSLKLQLKEQRKATERVQGEKLLQEKKHKEQVESLARKIYQERQSKDEAIARVVALSGTLAKYQSEFGELAG